jgi:acyl phosphate:glycerol-3-phosphate acyltransferase
VRRPVGRVALAVATGYLAGTVPWADLAARAASDGAVDLRTEGSGNPGGLNAAKLLGRRWGVAVIVGDAGKGIAAAGVGRKLAGDAGAYAAATAAVAGHCWPVWSGFRGGKGVATWAGCGLACFPAFFPVDAIVAASGAWVWRDPERTMRLTCAAWTAAAVVWWRRQWPNAWGPRPTVALPLFSAATSAMILRRFRA